MGTPISLNVASRLVLPKKNIRKGLLEKASGIGGRVSLFFKKKHMKRTIPSLSLGVVNQDEYWNNCTQHASMREIL